MNMSVLRNAIRRNFTYTTCILFIGISLIPACSSHNETSEKTISPVRTISLGMYDTYFSPATIDVTVGETVLFVFENFGKLTHDAFLGDTAAQEEHEKKMQSGTMTHDEHALSLESSGVAQIGVGELAMGSHSGGEEAPHLSIQPGKKGQYQYTFTDTDTLIIGCHEPGHYAQGMRVTITPREASS